jgi:hypothetical protein
MDSHQEEKETLTAPFPLTDGLAALREIAMAATQGEWKYGATPCPDKTKAMELFEANVDATKTPNEYFFEVFLDDGRRTAVVGNGPTSEANSRFIAAFGPQTALQLLNIIEELMAAKSGCTPK